MIRDKKCITCFQSKPVAEFYPSGCTGIMRDCNACREAEVAQPRQRPVAVTPASQLRRQEREASAPGCYTDEQKQARWDYYGGRCWMCRGTAVVMDHVKPLFRGGCNWPSNLRPACHPCNIRKAAYWPLPVWIARLYAANEC